MVNRKLSVAIFIIILAAGAIWVLKNETNSNDIPYVTAGGISVPPEVRNKFKELMVQNLQPHEKIQDPYSTKEAQDFRTSLSDLAWGRNRQPKQSMEKKMEAHSTPSLQNSNLDLVRSRMEHCMKNRDKDPSCR